MSKTIKLKFVCPSEREVLGYLVVEPGEVINAETIREYFDSARDRSDDGAQLRYSAKDRSYLICPRCNSMVMIGLDEQDVDTVISDNFVVLVGAIRYPDPEHRHSDR